MNREETIQFLKDKLWEWRGVLFSIEEEMSFNNFYDIIDHLDEIEDILRNELKGGVDDGRYNNIQS